MTALLWFHGIHGSTKIRDIGWFYALIGALVLFIAWNVYSLVHSDG